MSYGFSQFISNMDAFGSTINLNFRGKERFQTMRGGILTILIYIMTIWQMSIRALLFYQQVDPKISTYETSYLADQPLNLLEYNQQIRFAINNNGEYSKSFDPRAGTIQTVWKEDYGNGESITTDLELDYCNSDELRHLDMTLDESGD